MFFGIRSGDGGRTNSGRRGSGAVAFSGAAWCVIAALFCLALAGCSGGSSGSPRPSPSSSSTPPPGATATLVGSVLDVYANNTAASNVVVAFGPYYTLTDATGSYSLAIPAGTAGSLRFYGKAVRNASNGVVLGTDNLPTSDGTYRDTGYYQNALVLLSSQGIPIAAQSTGQTLSLGSVGLLSNDGPPPPPPI